MLAEMPERRMSGKPTRAPIAAATAPPASAPAGAGQCWCASSFGRSGRKTDFWPGAIVSNADT